MSSLGSLGGSSSGAQAATTLEQNSNALDAAADDFNDIKPPDDAKHAHGKMVDGLHKLAGTFRSAAKSAKTNDLSAVAKVLTDVTTSDGAKEIQEAENELKSNGYKFASS